LISHKDWVKKKEQEKKVHKDVVFIHGLIIPYKVMLVLKYNG
jgi:hypothetical protein